MITLTLQTEARRSMRGLFLACEPIEGVASASKTRYARSLRTAHVNGFDVMTLGMHLVQDVPSLQCDSLHHSLKHRLVAPIGCDLPPE